jgi:hypothetical protein
LVDRQEATLAERMAAALAVNTAKAEDKLKKAEDDFRKFHILSSTVPRASAEVRKDIDALSTVPDDVLARRERDLTVWEARQRTEWLYKPHKIATLLRISLGEITACKDRAEDLSQADFLAGVSPSPSAVPSGFVLDVNLAIAASQRVGSAANGTGAEVEERRAIARRWPCLRDPQESRNTTSKLRRRAAAARATAERICAPEPPAPRSASRCRPDVEARIWKMRGRATVAAECAEAARAAVSRLGLCTVCTGNVSADADAAEKAARELLLEMDETARAFGHASAGEAAAAGAWTARDQFLAAEAEKDAIESALADFQRSAGRYDELKEAERTDADLSFLGTCASAWRRETSETRTTMSRHVNEIADMRAFAEEHGHWLCRKSAVEEDRKMTDRKRCLRKELEECLTAENAAAGRSAEKVAAVVRAKAMLEAVREEASRADARRAALKVELERTRRRRDEIRSVHDRMFGTDAYRSWLYRTHVVPLLRDEMNRLLVPSAGIRVTVESNAKKRDIAFGIEDRGSALPLENASGFQRFIVDLALRLALTKIGSGGGRILRHLFMDEGFTACDSENVRAARAVIDCMREEVRYDSVILVSHLDAIRDAADACVSVERNGHESFIRA